MLYVKENFLPKHDSLPSTGRNVLDRVLFLLPYAGEVQIGSCYNCKLCTSDNEQCGSKSINTYVRIFCSVIGADSVLIHRQTDTQTVYERKEDIRPG